MIERVDIKFQLKKYSFIDRKGLFYIETKLKNLLRKIYWFSYYFQLRRILKQVLFEKLVYRCPMFGSKIFRPYLSAAFDIERRLKMLTDNYKILKSKGLHCLYSKNSDKKIVILNFDGKLDAKFRITYRLMISDEQEGELFFYLEYRNICIQKIGLSLFYENGMPCIYISLVQGGKRADFEIIKEATKMMYGNRPRDILLMTIIGFGHHFNFDKIVGVENKNRIGCSGFRNRHKYVQLNYDEMWRELFFTKCYQNDFELSCKFFPNYLNRYLVATSSKRAEKKRRDSFRSQLSEQFNKSMELMIES